MSESQLAFISYSSKDRNVANAVVAGLEQRGVRCWIAPRDIEPGAEWAEAIMDGIKRASVMVIVFSGNANESRQVLREVERAINFGLTVIPFRIEDIQPSGSMEYFLAVPHWLDAMNAPMEQSIERLYHALPATSVGAGAAAASTAATTGVADMADNRRGKLVGTFVAIAVVVAAGVWFLFGAPQTDTPPGTEVTPGPVPVVPAAPPPPAPPPAPDPARQLQELLAGNGATAGAAAIKNAEGVLALRKHIPNQQLGLKLWLDPDRYNFSGGDRFTIKMSASKDCYVAVFVHSSDGSTVLLYPNRFDEGTTLRKDTVMAVGDGSAAFELEVQPPWGIDVIHAIASTDREAMVELMESMSPIDGTPYRVADKATLSRGIGLMASRGVGAVATPSASASATAAPTSAWGDALVGIVTHAR